MILVGLFQPGLFHDWKRVSCLLGDICSHDEVSVARHDPALRWLGDDCIQVRRKCCLHV